MRALTDRQKNILSYINSEAKEKGYPPTVREIAKAVGLKSSSSVHGHLDRLEKRGYIRRDPTKPRAIEVLEGNEFQVITKHNSREEAEKLFYMLEKMGYNVSIK